MLSSLIRFAVTDGLRRFILIRNFILLIMDFNGKTRETTVSTFNSQAGLRQFHLSQ
jgi:hypothetical protein